MSSSKQEGQGTKRFVCSSQLQDVNDFVEINIGLTIDILWVTALAGMVASLSFMEWQRSGERRARVQIPTAKEKAAFAPAASAQGGALLAQVVFLGCMTIFTAALFAGGWYGSISMSWWAILLLAILSALSITQTIIAMRRWMRVSSRRAATPAI
jgi:hypothetical protein